MPKPHATADNDRRRILNYLSPAILNLSQAQKDLTECEPEDLLKANKHDELPRLARKINELASEFLRLTPGA